MQHRCCIRTRAGALPSTLCSHLGLGTATLRMYAHPRRAGALLSAHTTMPAPRSIAAACPPVLQPLPLRVDTHTALQSYSLISHLGLGTAALPMHAHPQCADTRLSAL